MSKELALSFRLADIETEEFAILEDSYSEGENVRLATYLDFGADKKNHVLGSNVKFQFEQDRKPFLVISVTCAFEMEEEAWESLRDKESNVLKVPEGFASHMAVLTVGTARGVLHEKTNGTPFNSFIIPPINLTEMIEGDIEIEMDYEVK